ncbi:restriction endonuclease subunit S [Microbulbifer sp.]|uniref:restriction endonuclease subunit S n=1 Tax=Microbulbifer sp. TaxID=1908541 RepID=UPI003F34A9AB
MTDISLPIGWVSKALADVGVWVGGGTPSKGNPHFWNGHIPWVSPKDMKSPEIVDTKDHISDRAVENSSVRLLPEGSVLFVTRSGILAHSFPVATTRVSATVNQDIKAIVPSPEVCPKYLAWALRARAREILNTCTKFGTTVHSIEVPLLKRLKISIPSRPEQERIVAKIEALFSELDKGIESLKAARQQLKAYRQAVLKHAFEGKLTEQWRQQNPDKLEPPEQLIARIQREREQRYQQQLEEWKQAVKAWEGNGKEGKKPGKPKAFKTTSSSDEHEIQVPDNWAVIELGSLAQESVLGKMLDKQKNTGIERPYLGNINVRWGEFDLFDLKSMRVEESEVSRYSLVEGDLVICEGGEPGRCAIWKGNETVFIQKALHRVRFTESYDFKFAFYYMVYATPLERVVKNFTGTTIKHLTGAGLNKIQFPLCSLNEQKEVIKSLEASLSGTEAMEKEIDAQIKKSEALRQSILKKAFSGQLAKECHD